LGGVKGLDPEDPNDAAYELVTILCILLCQKNSPFFPYFLQTAQPPPLNVLSVDGGHTARWVTTTIAKVRWATKSTMLSIMGDCRNSFFVFVSDRSRSGLFLKVVRLI
jgi:hypothetical protein